MTASRSSSSCRRAPASSLRVAPFLLPVSRSPRRPRAFTLLELLTVIAIIALLTVLTVPAVKALSTDNARVQAAAQVRAALSNARALAIAQHRQAGVVFFDESPKYALPVHGTQTAIQLFVEDYDQSQYAHDSRNTVFVPYSPARDYLPAGLALATLNDDVTRGVTTGAEASASLGRTRAVLFDDQGRMTTRHGLARPDLAPSNSPGVYPWAMGDWLFTTKGGNPSVGISSPGLFLYDPQLYQAQNIPADHSGDAARNSWIKAHATAILLNANTGALLP
jgi:prepilin-type N-terminal cleavage/methylation domain-containing protein